MANHGFVSVAPGVDFLKTPFGGGWSGVYLLRGDGVFLIDSGADAATVDAVIVPALAALALSPADVDLLLCTHSHGDHVGGHRRLMELGVKSCGVYAGGADKLRDPLKFSKRIRAAFPDFSPPPPPVLDGVVADRLLQDGEIVGGRLRLIHTPGHDDDAVAYFDEATGTLLTGDSAQGDGTPSQGCALYMDLSAYRASLAKLLTPMPERIVPGHAFLPLGEDRPDTPAASRAWLRECLNITEHHAALIAHAKAEIGERFETPPGDAGQEQETVATLARSLVQTLGHPPPPFLFLAMFTVRAQLEAGTQKHP